MPPIHCRMSNRKRQWKCQFPVIFCIFTKCNNRKQRYMIRHCRCRISGIIQPRHTRDAVEIHRLSGFCFDSPDFVRRREKFHTKRRQKKEAYRFAHNGEYDAQPSRSNGKRFASSCLESGVECKTVSSILGHSSTQITMDLYVHATLKQKAKCVNMF